jgi:hypothetical protein
MTKKQKHVASTGNTQKVYRAISHEQISFEMVLPPGTALADLFITAKEVMGQLKVGKRKLAICDGMEKYRIPTLDKRSCTLSRN